MTEKPQKQWRFRPAEDSSLVRELAASINMPELFGALLLQRGIDSPEAAQAFLCPTLAQLPSPHLLKGMDKAVQILGDAIREQRPIIIYGDYDVDGITATAVLALFLKELGVDCQCCQPSRFNTGYGFDSELVENATKGTVLVTVDCGVGDVDQVARAKEMGLTVIVTDHHQPPDELPAADALINPLQPGCEFPYKYMAGVGVAFYLAMGLRGHLVDSGFFADQSQAPNLKAFLDLVAIGTICDMVPLVEVNRIMTIAGLEVLARSNRLGLRYLVEVANISADHVTSSDVGCRLGPRLNAPGRMGSAEISLQLVMSDDPAQAKVLAQQVDAVNHQRQEVVRQVVEVATERAVKRVKEGANSLVLHENDWHGGVLGIVASRLADDFNRPAIMLSVNRQGLLKGSGRSVPGFDLHAALADCADLLENYGGHTCAVGLALQPDRLTEFMIRFDEVVTAKLDKDALQPLLWIDQVVSAEDLTHADFINGYQRLEPFGVGNPEPVFASSEEIVFENAKVVGNDHLKFTARINGSRWAGIGFGFGGFLDQVEGQLTRPAFTVRKNFFRGREEWQLNVVDISPPVTN